jgi:hypothetical protein
VSGAQLDRGTKWPGDKVSGEKVTRGTKWQGDKVTRDKVTGDKMTRGQSDPGTKWNGAKWPRTKWPGNKVTGTKWLGTKWKGTKCKDTLYSPFIAHYASASPWLRRTLLLMFGICSKIFSSILAYPFSLPFHLNCRNLSLNYSVIVFWVMADIQKEVFSIFFAPL